MVRRFSATRRQFQTVLQVAEEPRFEMPVRHQLGVGSLIAPALHFNPVEAREQRGAVPRPLAMNIDGRIFGIGDDVQKLFHFVVRWNEETHRQMHVLQTYAFALLGIFIRSVPIQPRADHSFDA